MNLMRAARQREAGRHRRFALVALQPGIQLFGHALHQKQTQSQAAVLGGVGAGLLALAVVTDRDTQGLAGPPHRHLCAGWGMAQSVFDQVAHGQLHQHWLPCNHHRLIGLRQ